MQLVELCEAFFSALSEGQLDFVWSNNPAVDPVKQTERWKTAAAIAHQQVPNILKQIDEGSRIAIHGSTAVSSIDAETKHGLSI